MNHVCDPSAGPCRCPGAEPGWALLYPGDRMASAAYFIMRHARTEVWPAGPEEQRRLLRRARAHVHPDVAGNRQLWDDLEGAARELGLLDGPTRS